MSPRVGMNLLWLVPGVVGGSEEYTTRLLDAVAEQQPSDLELVLYGNRLVFEAYPALADRFETVVAPVTGRQKSLRVWAESTWLARATRRGGISLVHHLGGIMPFRRTVTGMLTVHDLQPLVMPEHFAPVKRNFSRVSIPYSIRRAPLIVTLTEVTRTMMVERIGADPDRIHVIPAGVRIPDSSEREAAASLRVRDRYGLGSSAFFLYPAITYAHKNHIFLLEAFARVLRSGAQALLVLTGGPGPIEQDLGRVIAEQGLESQVRRLGRIPRAHLDALYWEATSLVFPSLFEGFGIPLLEAMSRGCPVLASDATALPEVGGDAAVLIDPTDAEAWATWMTRLLDDDDLRSRLAQAGTARAVTFDWTGAASQLLDLYRNAVGEAVEL